MTWLYDAGMEGEGGDEVQGQNEVRLRHALDPRTRRWARAEFFCSALDRPWLADDGVQTLCNHFGLKLGQLARLTRTEWTCIRRSLGRPRRLSLAFLRQVCSALFHIPTLNCLVAAAATPPLLPRFSLSQVATKPWLGLGLLSACLNLECQYC